ncbi:MAG: protein kinase [Vicinamibacterales bacterium]|nr:protein kinase [Vicinamibacterales bacterium]
MTPGTQLGPYEVLSLLGSGGMGEVYRARDTKLNRDVALKILPDAVASDADRLARFTREAQTLAALNHPNIAAIYGIEESRDVRALVMELVDGEDLSAHIARGPMSLAEVVPIARQIAEALEAAHEQGIIHRDLKPANIKVRADGTVKVLDFGLAKAMDPVGASGVNAMNSPTLSIHATQAGLILGTAAYMSPEQARGKPVDKRADIWSYGVVLYEMLTGQRAFKGDDVSETLASVLKDSPAFDALPPSTPPRLRRILERCLERDAKARLRDIGEARVELAKIASGDGDLSEASAIAGASAAASPAWRRALPWAMVGALAVGLTLVLALWVPWRMAPAPTLQRLSADLGAEVSLTFGTGDATSLSPDGTVVAFVAQKSGGGSPQIYVRRLTQLQPTLLSGTDEARSPFFSPDGEWIAFFAGGKLKKVAVAGGAAVTLCDAPEDRGGAWSEDGTIMFAPNPRGSVMRVSSAGGTPEPVSSLAEGEVSQRWPQVLPGGTAVLFTSGGAGIAYDDANLVVQSLSTGARTVVQRGGYHGRYLPSGRGSPERAGREGGHLVYLHAGTLFAVPFDLDRLAVTGPPVPAFEGVATNTVTGAAQFAVSASGTVVYVPGPSSSGSPIQWMDHEGKTTPLRATPANWFDLLFAPDGHRLAFQILGEQLDIWVYEWARDTLTRLTFDPALDKKPVWTPDGRRLVFASARADKLTLNLYWQRADGTGDTQRLTESKQSQEAASWHPSGTLLAFEEQHPQTSYDLMILPMSGDEAAGWKPGTPTVFLNSPFSEREPMFSPDGRWLAYVSNESGRNEMYVRPYPGPGGKWQISTGGGNSPTWSRTKRELFYGVNGQIMVAPYAVEADSFRAEKPRLWSEGRYTARGNRMFDLHPDGTRVALAPVAQTGGVKQDHVTFLFNFFDELRRIAPVAKQ